MTEVGQLLGRGGGSWELVSKRGGRGRARSLNIFGGGAL